MAAVVPFTSAAKRHYERIMALSWTPGTSQTLLTSGANTQIRAYPYLRSLVLHVYTTGGSGGNLAADGPWNMLSTVGVTDTNGSGIYGGQTFTGFDAFLTQFFGGYRERNDPTQFPLIYDATAATPEFTIRIPFEYNHRTGAGSLPNMSANATYGLNLIGNTIANIWQTAPTTTPVCNVDVWMENWTLPDAQDLLGRNQMQGPPLLGTTQYVTKQTYTTVDNSANTIQLTRKGNMLRKWIMVARTAATGVRIPTAGAVGTGPGGGAYPNPFEFWWDGNRLSSDDPKLILQRDAEVMSDSNNAAAPGVAQIPVGALCYDFSDPYGKNSGADGEGGWLATTQSSRLEFVGSNWGGGAAVMDQLDIITIDVAPIALANQYALDSQTGKLLYPAQPEVRGG